MYCLFCCKIQRRIEFPYEVEDVEFIHVGINNNGIVFKMGAKITAENLIMYFYAAARREDKILSNVMK